MNQSISWVPIMYHNSENRPSYDESFCNLLPQILRKRIEDEVSQGI